MPIETGRWRNINRNMKFCRILNKEVPLYIRMYFDKLRKLYFNEKYFFVLSDLKMKNI